MRKKFPRSQFSADVLWELLRFADAFLGQKTSGGGNLNTREWRQVFDAKTSII